MPAWVSSTNAVEFFTNMSSRLLAASGYPFDSANIPVYTNGSFVFSPDVHRILQVSLNLFDASANHRTADGVDFPTVLHPTFRQEPNGSNVDIFISGFTEVVRVDPDLLLADPQLLTIVDLNTRDNSLPLPDNANIYGVPWLIGARKGFPSFNEFAMQSVSQIARRLQIRKLTPSTAPIATNQLFIVGISNMFAVEAWNPYQAAFNRSVRIHTANTLAISMRFTNDMMLDKDRTGALPTWFATVEAATALASNAWQGIGSDPAVPNKFSFQVPLVTNITFLPDSFYRTALGIPRFTINVNDGANLVGGFEQTGQFPLPEFDLAVSNRIRFLIVDEETGRVIDYVQLNDLNGKRSLGSELDAFNQGSIDGGASGVELQFWRTNRQSKTLTAPPSGAINQIIASLGAITVANWNSVGQWNGGLGSKESQIISFRRFMFAPYTGNTSNVMVVPFTPIRKISQHLKWQANDPIVRFTTDDLRPTGPGNGLISEQPNGTIFPLRNIGKLNDRFEPWGGRPTSTAYTGPVPQFDPAYKDPRIWSSDAWDFGANGPLAIDWIGKVHRGTPWQTLYLKSADADPYAWQPWLGWTKFESAYRARPISDRPIIDSLLQLLNTENPNRLLSINTTHTNEWRHALNKVTVLTNITPDVDLTDDQPAARFDTDIMHPGDPQAVTIIQGIMDTRAGRVWENVSDVLATPELAEQSPWLNTHSTMQLRYGISDEAYEAIASRLLPRLRADAKGSVRMSANGSVLEFTGYDGGSYAIETSNDLIHWHRIGLGLPTNGIARFIDSTPAGSDSRFYRSRLLP